MPTMDDYLLWRGDITFDERPFNEVDNLILSCLVYMDFTGIIAPPGEGSCVLGEAVSRLLDKAGDKFSSYVRSVAHIEAHTLELLGASERFSHVRLHDYVDVLDEHKTLQFAALTADIVPNLSYVAYRGTDTSLVGWRENFVASYQITESQKMAAAYLEDALRTRLGEKHQFVVGGHSKGGNLTAYACAVCPAELRPSISKIFINDGEGFPRDVLAQSAYDVFGDRVVRFQPAYSVVGEIFDRPEEPRIYIKSDAQGILQHDLTTWQVEKDHFVRADGLDRDAQAFDEALNMWALSRDFSERAQVTRVHFDAFEAAGVHDVADSAATLAGLQKVILAINSVDEETRKIMHELLNAIFASKLEHTRLSATRRANGLMRSAKEVVDAYFTPKSDSDMPDTSEITSDANRAEPNDAI
ncbi:MAG: Mbeg1-like protein [Atopobiaceae bacterium]|jgi:hypothetical protein